MRDFDLIVVGGGAAGSHCAASAGTHGLRVLVVDHAESLAQKIRISGGGRSNFTNLQAARPERYITGQPRFARSVLRAYPPERFIDKVRDAGIGFHEKHRGQLFCDESSSQLIELLVKGCRDSGVQLRFPVSVQAVSPATPTGYRLQTSNGELTTRSLIIATGGLSIPKIGASDFAYRLARQFGVPVVATRPGLVPLTFDAAAWAPYSELSGASLSVGISVTAQKDLAQFDEDLLLTHRGLSGPAILQISNYWQPGQQLSIDLTPSIALEESLLREFVRAKDRASPSPAMPQLLADLLERPLPRRFLSGWLHNNGFGGELNRRLPEWSRRRLVDLAASMRNWTIAPNGTEGYKKAEVTLGGIDTRALNPATMGVLGRPDLYFIGEAVDVTGWLGGYNFQWAWASAHVAAQAVAAATIK